MTLEDIERLIAEYKNSHDSDTPNPQDVLTVCGLIVEHLKEREAANKAEHPASFQAQER